MRGIDPAIELVACGSSGRRMNTYLEWDRVVLETCWEDVEYISAHRYSRNTEDDSAWFLAEGVEIDRILNDYAGLLAYVRGVKKSEKRISVAFDEWNVWYKDREIDGSWTHAPHLIEEVYNLEDALVCAQFLNSFLRHANTVKIACIAQIVNVIAPILTRPDGLLIQSIYYPLQLFSQHARGTSLIPIIESPTYAAGARGEVPMLDVSASYEAESDSVSCLCRQQKPLRRCRCPGVLWRPPSQAQPQNYRAHRQRPQGPQHMGRAGCNRACFRYLHRGC